MFCSECGQQAAGKFCSSCGARLVASGGQHIIPFVEPIVDWSNTTDYQSLLRITEVRDRIARAGAQSKKKMTGEEFLEIYGNALGKLSGLPIKLPMSSFARFLQSLYAKMGIKTGKSRSQFYSTPPGTLLVALLCALARHGRTLRTVQQLSDGCTIVAALPSDLLALEGDLVITVTRAAYGGSHVDARTNIPGQMFDFGKSARCLKSLLADLAAPAAAA
jgi:hypothetical protein